MSHPVSSPPTRADGKVQFFVGVQMELKGGPEGAGVAADGAAVAALQQQQLELPGAGGVPVAAPEPDALLLLKQRGVVGSLWVATRALAQHGLRRAVADQQRPHHLSPSHEAKE